MANKFVREPSVFFRKLSSYLGIDISGKPCEECISLTKMALFSEIRKSINYVSNVPFLHIQDIDLNKRMQFSDEVDRFLKSRKILIVELSDTGNLAGSLIPTNEGFIVLINENINKNRILSIFSHEIGHTYFYEILEGKPRLFFESYILNNQNIYAELEGLAYEIGRELILPKEQFIKYLLNEDLMTQTLENFIKIYRNLKFVSLDIIAERLYHDLELWGDSYLFWGSVNKEYKFLIRNKDKYRRGKNKFRQGVFDKFILKKEIEATSSPLREALLNAIEEGVNISGKEITLNELGADIICRLNMQILDRRKNCNTKFIVMIKYSPFKKFYLFSPSE